MAENKEKSPKITIDDIGEVLPESIKKPAKKRSKKNTDGQKKVEKRGAHLKPWHFKPGQSGNPKGVGAGNVSIVAIIKRKLKEVPRDANGNLLTINGVVNEKTYAELIAEKALQESLDGKDRFFKEILERTDGKVVQQQQIEVTDKMGISEAVEALKITKDDIDEDEE